MPVTCPHVVSIGAVGPAADVCSECVAIGAGFVHLRQCLTCGHTACCDASPNRHATAHHAATGHPIMRSLEPADDWMWCFDCAEGFRARNGGFAVVDFFFEAGLPYAQRASQTNGTAIVEPDTVTQEGFPLGTWIATYRSVAARGELEAEHRVLLEDLPGWTW
jgi:Zn-finger in ubiquitin-hydrolases and other protein